MVRWFLLAVSLLFATSAYATNRTVSTLADSGAGSLRNTIAASSPGDSIDFSVSGTIALTSGELVISKSLTIIGPAAGITVSGNNASRVFNITAGTVSISRLNIVNGNATGTNFADTNSGAGIMNKGTLTLSNCVFSNNAAVSSNSGSSAGGAIFSYNAALTIQSCAFINNSATGQTQFVGGDGGAIYNYQGTTIISDSTLSGNIATRGNPTGGGVGGDGGAIAVGGGNVSLKNCAVTGNVSTIVGGAIVNINSGSTLSVTTNSTLSGNNANSAPCIFSNGPLNITSSTISGNHDNGAGGGGGLYTFEAPTRILSTIIAGNTASSGPDVSSSGNIVSLGHNLIGVTDGSTGWVASDQTGTAGSPLNPQLGPLQNNGGPTLTMALANSSPAVNTGDDVVLTSPYNLSTDQRGPGFPRKQATHVDVGAYEADGPQAGTSFTVTTTADHDDGLCGIADCTLREAVLAANSAAGSNTIKFVSGLSGTIPLFLGELAVTDAVSIQGPGANVLAVSGNSTSRVWNINVPGLTVTISRLGIRNGSVFTSGDARGGGILNNATLNLSYCSLSANTVRGAQGGSMSPGFRGQGGGIYNTGTLNLSSCTFNGNQAMGGDGGFGGFDPGGGPGGTGGVGQGGAIYNEGTVTLNNCTIHGNFTNGGSGGSGTPSGNGGNGQGGGIFNAGTLTTNSCTITGNNASAGLFLGIGQGGGIYGASTQTIANTIIAGNTVSDSGPDIFGSFTSQSFNFIGKTDGGTGFTNGVKADQVGTIAAPKDPQLGPLQDNGGPTFTRALLIGSPALDKGKSALSVDQRGLTRPYDNPSLPNASGGNGGDIGAFERHQPSLSIADVSVTETNSGTANATFTVTLTDPGANTVTVQYATVDGTAKAPTDYTARSATTLTFTSGQTSKSFTIPIKGDTLDEIDESFFVNLSSPTNAVITDGQARCTIVDDDEAPLISINDIVVSEGDSGNLTGTFLVSLNNPSGKSITVKYATANGTALAPADYAAIPASTLTFTPGQTSKPVTVTYKGDLLNEANETFFVNLSAPVNATISDAQGQCIIADNDPLPALTINDVTVTEGNTGTVNANFTMTLSAASGRTVTLQYITANGTALAPADYTARPLTTLTFSPGQVTKTITVTVTADSLDEVNETFLVNLTNPVNAILANSQGVGTITDDDATPALSINNVTVTEGDSGAVSANFTLLLSAISGRPVTVQYATADGTAAAPDDYVAIPLTAFTFAPGQKSKTITVLVNGDVIDEANETFTVNLSSPTNATISDSQGLGTITANDSPSFRIPSMEAEPETSTLSGAEANISAATLELTFTGPAPANFTVLINGHPVRVQDIDFRRNVVTLYLPDGSVHAGDKIAVSWDNGDISLVPE